ncbi:DUF3800 domain-containing protein [Phenylobacterium sp.]|uniref:DUF3800 domain-containing protein n=1 Tax=Phenylobacterium sp. TaxID=1871053 RepID=UPI002731671F|nr:DUF3800 domain-containing protein [Phenylobacterium sp.]MDP1874298.1 DUF3800 domain-containing protein [Phenylobacterium sp.]
MAAFAEVYIDESGTHDGSPVMCVAGYLFLKAGANRFTKKWGKVLKREKIPFFHMVDFAPGNSPFDHMHKQKRIEVEKELIATIHDCAVFGFSVTVDEREYNEIITPKPSIGGAYSFCLRGCLAAISDWRKRTNFRGEIAYFFEAGHRDQSEANRIMHEVFQHEEARRRFAYGNHTFVEKTKVVPLQSADLLAWLWRNDFIRGMNNVRVSRADLVALVRPLDKTIAYRRPLLIELEEAITRVGGWGA